MNYNDQILENKEFKFFKQLMYNIAVVMCIILMGVLVLVYGFKYQLYNVISDSQAPYFYKNDMVIAKAQDSYKAGDIIKFNLATGIPVAHRLIYVHEENGVTYYICHGDNVDAANPDAETHLVPWEEDREYVKNYLNSGKTIKDLDDNINVQVITFNQIDGLIVGSVKAVGGIFSFIKDHSMLFIALVAAVWCVSYTIQSEMEIKRSLRLL